MNINKVLSDFNLNKKDIYCILALCLFALLITVQMIKFHQIRGAINSDVFAYLATSLHFAGMNDMGLSSVGYFFNSPVIFYLTSLIFKLGYVDINAMFILTGIFGIIGILGMYVLLRAKFTPLLSLFGTILYSSFSMTLLYYANGMLDVPAVSMLIWVLVFTIAAVDKNPKYYLLVFLTGALAFFTRFTNGYAIPVILLYVLKNHDIIYLIECLFKDKKVFMNRITSFLRSDEFKWILISLVFGIILALLILFIVLSQDSSVNYISMATGSVGRYSNPQNSNYVTDRLFYIKNYLSLLFTNSITFHDFIEDFNSPAWFTYVIVGILFGGILLKCVNFIKGFDSWKEKDSGLACRGKNTAKILFVVCAVLVIVGVIGFKFNYFITLIAFWLIFIILMSIIREYPIDKDDFSLYCVFLSLFIFYIVAFSFLDVKCVRYVLPTFPAVVFMAVYSLDYLLKSINGRSDNEKSNIVSYGVPIILIVICLFFAFNFTNTVEIPDESIDIVEISDFIKEYDPDYQNKSFAVEHTRFFQWYLQMHVYRLNTTNLKDTYLISDDEINDSGYKEIYYTGNHHVYEKIGTP